MQANWLVSVCPSVSRPSLQLEWNSGSADTKFCYSHAWVQNFTPYLSAFQSQSKDTTESKTLSRQPATSGTSQVPLIHIHSCGTTMNIQTLQLLPSFKSKRVKCCIWINLNCRKVQTHAWMWTLCLEPISSFAVNNFRMWLDFRGNL